jgi:hypothetical protein
MTGQSRGDKSRSSCRKVVKLKRGAARHTGRQFNRLDLPVWPYSFYYLCKNDECLSETAVSEIRACRPDFVPKLYNNTVIFQVIKLINVLCQEFACRMQTTTSVSCSRTLTEGVGCLLLLQISPLQRGYISNAKTRLPTYELQAVIGEEQTKCSLCMHKLKILLRRGEISLVTKTNYGS